MAIARVGSATPTSGTTSTTPTGTAGNIGDMQLLMSAWGVDTSQTDANRPTGPEAAGWTHLHTLNSGTVGAESYGVDLGPRASSVWFKIALATSAEAPTLTSATIGTAGNRVVTGCIVRYSKGASEYWDYPVATGGTDTVKADGWAASGTTNIGGMTGDYLVWHSAIQPDTVNPAVGLTWTGLTLGTITNIQTSALTSGNDVRTNSRDVNVTAGTSSAAPSLTSATTGGAGATSFVRLRVLPVRPTIVNINPALPRSVTW